MCAALVTGASQGVGKGIVEGLAEAGLQVFFTGRDAERLQRTAAETAALGGEGFPRRVDHGDDAAVEALFAEIERGYRLDLLVNNVWGGYERMVENGRCDWHRAASPLRTAGSLHGNELRARSQSSLSRIG